MTVHLGDQCIGKNDVVSFYRTCLINGNSNTEVEDFMENYHIWVIEEKALQ